MIGFNTCFSREVGWQQTVANLLRELERGKTGLPRIMIGLADHIESSPDDAAGAVRSLTMVMLHRAYQQGWVADDDAMSNATTAYRASLTPEESLRYHGG